jgi:DNA-binding beta-propeller fold protein YncE
MRLFRPSGFKHFICLCGGSIAGRRVSAEENPVEKFNGKLLAIIAYVVGHEITILDVEKRRAVPNSLYVGDQPTLIAATPAGALALFVNPAHLTVIDLSTLTAEPGTIPLGNNPAGIAITSDGALALVVNWLSKNMTVINIATRTARNYPLPNEEEPRAIALTADGSRAVVLFTDNAFVI